MQRLDLSSAAPDDGYLTDTQACERKDEVLAHVARLPKLEDLSLFQPVSLRAMVLLTTLGNLTNLQPSTPHHSEARKLKLWDIQELLQQKSFHLRELHFEFKLDGHRVT